MREKLRSITESTLVPLGVVCVLLTAAFYVGGAYFQQDANAKAIVELKAKQDAMASMATDIAVIRTKVEAIEEKLSE